MRLVRILALASAMFAGVVLAPPAHGQGSVPTGFVDVSRISIGSATALDQPTAMAFLPDGRRVLVVEQKTARVRLFVDGALSSPDPMFTVQAVKTTGPEQGLLGIAVDPGWPARPYLYVDCDDANLSVVRVSRYAVTGDVSFTRDGHLSVNPATRYDVVRMPDNDVNHNGGTLRFGTDGMLYISIGDDEKPCAAQDSTQLLGKILRVDVTRLPNGGSGPANLNLITPAGNPFAASRDTNARLVWEQGLRNPFRFSLDAPTGAIWIGDVGEATWEEIDRATSGGRNFGWPLREGPAPYDTSGDCGPLRVGDPPVYAFYRLRYTAAIVGGTTYHKPDTARAPFSSAYEGDYFFSDYYFGFLRRLKASGSSWVLAPRVAGQPTNPDSISWGQGYQSVTDWQVGPDGALWYVKQNRNGAPRTGDLRAIASTDTTTPPPPPPPPPPDTTPSETLRTVFAPPFPSPARDRAWFRYSLAQPAEVRMTIYDSGGRRVCELVPAEVQEAGPHEALWTGRNEEGHYVQAGVYIVRLEVAGRGMVRRIAWLK